MIKQRDRLNDKRHCIRSILSVVVSGNVLWTQLGVLNLTLICLKFDVGFVCVWQIVLLIICVVGGEKSVEKVLPL